MEERLNALTSINLDDLTAALGVENHPLPRRIVRALLRDPAEEFARQMLDFDEVTGISGLPEGARHAERRLARDVRVFGRELLPHGAFLALSNHPGLTDTLALFSALDRKDLKVIALERPFLMNLVNVSKQLFYLPDSPTARMMLVREVARALRNGAAVLTFPAGQIEPDPEVFPGAAESLENWLESAEVFVRMAPGTPIVPVCVSGVTWEAAANLPFVKTRRELAQRQLTASALQLLWQLVSRAAIVTVNVQIGRPITPSTHLMRDAAWLHREVLSEMRRLVQGVPDSGWQSAL